MDILMKALYLLIFPGLLYCSVAGLLLAGIDRKVVARMQKRIGPPLLQPAYDFFKLLGKETIVPAAAARRTFLAAPVIGLVSLVVTAVLVPVFGFSAFGGVADVVVILYLLTIPAVAIIMGGAASGSPYAGVGISREMVTMMAYELPLVIVLLAVGKAAGDGGVTFSLSKIVEYQQANGPLITNWTMWPAALAMLLVIPAEIGSHPFDVAEAETEICEGALVEYSGAPLALFKLSSAIKLYIMTALFSCLFLSGWGTGIVAVDALILVAVCAVIMLICVSLVRAVCARLKVEILFRFYWRVVAVLAAISLILAWLVG